MCQALGHVLGTEMNQIKPLPSRIHHQQGKHTGNSNLRDRTYNGEAGKRGVPWNPESG